MNIACITQHPYPTEREIRITKFAESLAQEQHRVFVLCPGTPDEPARESFAHGEILRFRAPVKGMLGLLLFVPLPINPLWLLWFIAQFAKLSLDLIIVRDLRLALPAFLAARWRKVRHILDIGENYPGMMKIVGKQRPHHYITRNIGLISLLEAMSVRLADEVWVVAEENRDRLLPFHKQGRIQVINNYPPLHVSVDGASSHTPYSEGGDPVKLLFFGIIDNIRGIDLAIRAFHRLRQELPNLEFHIYGDGPYREYLEGFVRELGEERVVFHGWVKEKNKYECMATGDIGMLLHTVCELTNTTIPNKVFDYMRVGLPVVSTPLRPLITILSQSEGGVIVEEDEAAVVAELRRLILAPEERRAMGAKGAQAVVHRYTWEQEATKVVSAAQALCSKEQVGAHVG